MLVGLTVFNATFNNISVVAWRPVLLVEETTGHRKHHWPVASDWQTWSSNVVNKGNNKITELRTILQGKVKTHKYINRQNQSTTGNCENRNDPDLVQAFLKKWWVESDLKTPNLPLSLRLRVSGCHYNSIYNNTWTKQVKQLSNQRQTQWSKCQRHFYVTHW